MNEEPFLVESRQYTQKCRYIPAYSSACGAPADDTGICDKHQGIKCCVCGAQSTNQCNYTGQFVCGAELCDDCEEGNAGDSTQGLGWGFVGHNHRRKIKLPVPTQDI